MVEIIEDEGRFQSFDIYAGDDPITLLVSSSFKKSKDGEAIEKSVEAFAEEYMKQMEGKL